VGADYIEIGELAGQAIVDNCGDGTSGEVAIVQGVLTAAASAYQLRGVSNILSQHPNIKIVSNQAADWDSSKARTITETTLQQNPNLCGVIGFWDGMDVGVGAAVQEAGKADDVFVVTSGGGGKAGCDNLENGFFDLNISYDVPGQARDLSDAIKALLQTDYEPGSNNFLWYTKLKLLTKENLDTYRGSGACWTVDSIASN
jgi:ribose transport system substrate-binding protein